MKLLRRNNLDNALYEAGLISSPRYGYPWILKREVGGNLICPRDPVTRQRMFTAEQIMQIVKAFSPGGKGEWKGGEKDEK